MKGEITAELSNCISTGELLRNKARPFVLGATPALSLPVHFMLSSHFFPLQKKTVNVCLYISLCLRRIFERKVRNALILEKSQPVSATQNFQSVYKNTNAGNCYFRPQA